MSRVIRTEGAGKDRNQLCRGIVAALRELTRQTDTGATTKDLAAFIALALLETHATVDESVAAWEKKGYWVKADRFRMDWEWTRGSGEKLMKALKEDDWPAIAMLSAHVGEKLVKVTVPERNRVGKPWVGAYKTIKEQW